MSEHTLKSEPGRAGGAAPDRRREPRLRSLLTGIIIFDNKCTMDCTVRNISAYGAKVILSDAFRLPEKCNLRIPHHDTTHRAVIVWRKGDAAGFALSDVLPAVHPPRHRQSRREAERAHQREQDAAQF
jgi:hypothetical protein